MKTITIECEGASVIEIEKVEPFQGELKSLSVENYEKLKKSILDLGFSFPLHVWKTGDHHYCIDGHQRDRVLLQMQKEGYKIPKIPIVFVKAKDEREAKRKILAATSTYGVIEKQGFYEFMNKSDIGIDELKKFFRSADVNLKQFEKEFFIEGNMQDSTVNMKDTYEIVIECTNQQDQEKLFNKLTYEGIKCRVLTY